MTQVDTPDETGNKPAENTPDNNALTNPTSPSTDTGTGDSEPTKAPDETEELLETEVFKVPVIQTDNGPAVDITAIPQPPEDHLP